MFYASLTRCFARAHLSMVILKPIPVTSLILIRIPIPLSHLYLILVTDKNLHLT